MTKSLLTTYIEKIVPIFISVIIVVFVISWETINMQADGLLHIFVLDIGQGDSTLIKTPNGKYILIDVGSNSYKLESELQKYIPWYNRSIDLLVFSHPHADHFAGYFSLEKKYPAFITLISSTLNDNSFKSLFKQLEESSNLVISDSSKDWYIDNVKLDTLYPVNQSTSLHHKNVNLGSIVQKLTYKNFDMLFTGDLEKEGLDLLADLYENNLQSEFLKAPHHGSRNGWSEEFLKVVLPKEVTISAGLNNRHGHPHQEFLDAKKRYNVKIHNTAKLGTIEIITNGLWYQLCYKETKKLH